MKILQNLLGCRWCYNHQKLKVFQKKLYYQCISCSFNAGKRPKQVGSCMNQQYMQHEARTTYRKKTAIIFTKMSFYTLKCTASNTKSTKHLIPLCHYIRWRSSEAEITDELKKSCTQRHINVPKCRIPTCELENLGKEFHSGTVWGKKECLQTVVLALKVRYLWSCDALVRESARISWSDGTTTSPFVILYIIVRHWSRWRSSRVGQFKDCIIWVTLLRGPQSFVTKRAAHQSTLSTLSLSFLRCRS